MRRSETLGPVDYRELTKVLQDVETNPDNTLFLMNEAQEGDPWIQIPLGDSKIFNGYLIMTSDGWFIHRDQEK